MLNKPITHPTIKSFVYLDIDSRRDKGSPLPLSTKAAILGGTPLARSLVRYARLRLLVRAGPSAEKGVPMLPMNAVCAVSKRKLILGEKGEGGRKKERREEEQSRSVEGEKESGGKRARQCTKSRKTHGETLQPGEEGGQKPIMDTMVDGSSLFLSRLCGPSAG